MNSVSVQSPAETERNRHASHFRSLEGHRRSLINHVDVDWFPRADPMNLWRARDQCSDLGERVP
jgi:hypothetical protein